jgi:hypothetical protein
MPASKRNEKLKCHVPNCSQRAGIGDIDENKRIKNNTFKSCAEATEPVGKRGEESITERDNTSGNPSRHFIMRFINSTCPPVHHVDPLPQTAAREPVLVRHAHKNERNEIMKTIAYTGHFYTTPDLVRPPGAEIEEGNLLAGNPSLVTGIDSIDPQTFTDVLITAATEPVLEGREIIDGNDHFITRFLNSTSPESTSPTQPCTWTSLLTQSMSIVGGGNVSDLNVLDADNSYDSFHTPPPSPCAGLDVSVEVFVTPPSSPATTGMVTSGKSTGSSIPTPPCTTLRIPRTIGTRLSDVFAAQVPDIPVPNVDPGRVPMTSATLGAAPAGPSVTLGVDFIQINCGKRISAIALLETNVKNKIALIQEPYTSINGSTLIHKRDFFSSGTAPPSTTPAGAMLATSWTSLRPRAAIYAPGRSDVLPVHRFMTRDIATVATQLGFIASINMDITKVCGPRNYLLC